MEKKFNEELNILKASACLSVMYCDIIGSKVFDFCNMFTKSPMCRFLLKKRLGNVRRETDKLFAQVNGYMVGDKYAYSDSCEYMEEACANEFGMLRSNIYNALGKYKGLDTRLVAEAIFVTIFTFTLREGIKRMNDVLRTFTYHKRVRLKLNMEPLYVALTNLVGDILGTQTKEIMKAVDDDANVDTCVAMLCRKLVSNELIKKSLEYAEQEAEKRE